MTMRYINRHYLSIYLSICAESLMTIAIIVFHNVADKQTL